MYAKYNKTGQLYRRVPHARTEKAEHLIPQHTLKITKDVIESPLYPVALPSSLSSPDLRPTISRGAYSRASIAVDAYTRVQC